MKTGPRSLIRSVWIIRLDSVPSSATVARASALNFTYGDVSPADVRAAYDEQDHQRLARLKSHYDPENLFRLGYAPVCRAFYVTTRAPADTITPATLASAETDAATPVMPVSTRLVNVPQLLARTAICNFCHRCCRMWQPMRRP